MLVVDAAKCGQNVAANPATRLASSRRDKPCCTTAFTTAAIGGCSPTCSPMLPGLEHQRSATSSPCWKRRPCRICARLPAASLRRPANSSKPLVPTAGQKLTLPGDKNQPEQVILFDGTGRYTYERTPSLGLRETVVCDGTTLLHLYPEIGLAGRRTVSRFHRAELAGLLPWLLPPAEDLARGVDLKCVDGQTPSPSCRTGRAVKHVEARDAPSSTCRLHLLFKEGRFCGAASRRDAGEQDAGPRSLRWRRRRRACSDADGKEVSKITRQTQHGCRGRTCNPICRRWSCCRCRTAHGRM